MPIYKSSRSLLLEPLESRLALTGTPMPTFLLADKNVDSESYQQNISPAKFTGEVSAWYFAHATCGYCTTQFGHLNTLQQELAAAYPQLKIQILGVNDFESAAGNDMITAGRTLPWLQDTDTNSNGQSDGSTPIAEFVDTNADGFVSPLDALLVLVYLNNPPSQQAQGEADSESEIEASGPNWPSLVDRAVEFVDVTDLARQCKQC